MGVHGVDIAEGALLDGIPGVEVDVAFPTKGARPLCIPRTRLRIDTEQLACDIEQIEIELETGPPAIAILPEPAAHTIWLNPQHLADGEEELVAQRVAEVLRSKAGSTAN